MKVDILSMQRVHNYGSFLQSYGLKKLLEDNGCEVGFLDIKKGTQLGRDVVKSTLGEYENNKVIDKYFFRKIKGKIDEILLSKMFVNIHNEYFNIGPNFKYETSADCVVIGSDEVFNCLQDSEWGFSDQLFGNIVANKVITYAASCGFTRYQDIPKNIEKSIFDGLNNLYSISVRDENTKKFVNSFGFKNVVESLDPVLVSNFDEEINDAKCRKIKGDFLIVYAYKNRIHSKKEIFLIKKFAKKHQLKIVALGGPQKWADEFWVLNPFELLKAFKMANFIITDTFHGSIFSIKYNLNFITIERESNSNKLRHLFEKLEQSSRLVSNLNDLEYFYSQKPNYINTNNIIKEETLNSKNYLKNNISEIS